jgi:hypothetical protein
MDSKFINFVMTNGVLTEKHRQELKTKRGFPDSAINSLKFISTGSYWAKHFREGDWPEDKKNWLLSSQDDGRVIIPFFDSANNVIFLRPHKMGFKAEGLELYVPYPIYEQKEFTTLVIAESEFKAAASTYMGIQAVGIPGINTFAGEYFEKLRAFISANPKIERIVICFDNEVKDKPGFGNYKANYKDRYETLYWSYAMARMISESFPDRQALVATLPDDCMIDGKADIDGMLAMGRISDYRDCIEKAVRHEKYRASWKMPQSHISFLSRRIDRNFYKGPVVEIGNRLFIRDFKSSDEDDDKVKLKPVTNFRMEIVQTMKEGINIQRLIRYVSDYGNSEPILIDAESMTSKANFTKFCYKNGDYRFIGNEADMLAIWDYLFMHQDGRIVNRLQFYGYNQELDTWFFENAAYGRDKVYDVDENGIVWINEEGFKLFDNNDLDNGKSRLSSDEDRNASPRLTSKAPYFTLSDIYKHLSVLKGKDKASMMLAWTLGHFFIPEITKELNYPFMFFHGAQNQGKSTTARWISSFFGFDIKGYPVRGSSMPGIQRVCSQYSCLPVWLEEYRNDRSIDEKNAFFRSVYDGSTIVKGQPRPNEIMTIKARSNILFSGQEFPNDSALNSRCLHFNFSGNDPKGLESFKWMEMNREYFNYFGHEILLNRKVLWPKIHEKIKENLVLFADRKIENPRAIKHSSILGAIASVLFESSVEGDEYMISMTIDSIQQREKEKELNVFFDDIVSVHQGRGWGFPYYDVRSVPLLQDAFNQAYVMVLYFNSIYIEWFRSMGKQRNDIPISKSTLLSNLECENYFIGRVSVTENENAGGSGRGKAGWLINLAHDETPKVLFELLSDVERIKLKSFQNNPAAKSVKLIDLDKRAFLRS